MLGTGDRRICLRARGYAECVWHVGRCVGELWHIKSSISSSNVLNSGRKQHVFTGITEATSLYTRYWLDSPGIESQCG